MINPINEDIGRSVVYTPPRIRAHSLGGFKSADEFVSEVGTVTSYNDNYVFVRFGSDQHSKAVRRCDLHWQMVESIK